ncbi:Zn-ribbon domain-containing OB-fold protein [Rhodococcus daqingensis]|uniref:Zn-ribbon domain-containing OB-fold protein n=1 Tax=Rhodococcus daqingensis TaxID=2479363 RepID=A0ABW2RZR5_9NOCA
MRSAGGTHLWADLTGGALMIRRCECCALVLTPSATTCSSCGSDQLTRVPSTGEGSIVTWKVTDRLRAGVDDETLPGMLAVVALDDGPWICTWIEGEVVVHPGRPVRVRFHHLGSDERYPVFHGCQHAAPARVA